MTQKLRRRVLNNVNTDWKGWHFYCMLRIVVHTTKCFYSFYHRDTFIYLKSKLTFEFLNTLVRDKYISIWQSEKTRKYITNCWGLQALKCYFFKNVKSIDKNNKSKNNISKNKPFVKWPNKKEYHYVVCNKCNVISSHVHHGPAWPVAKKIKSFFKLC